MSILAVGCGLFLLLMLLPLNKAVLHSGGQQLGGYKAIYSMFTEQLASLKMIKSYGSEDYYLNEVVEQSQLLEQQMLRMTRINALTQLVYLVGAAISFSLYFYFAIAWLSVSLATLLLLLLIFSRLLPQLSSIQSTYQRLLHKIPAFEDVRQLMAACEAALEHSHNPLPMPPKLRQKLVLDQISFHYTQGNREIINKLSLIIPRNATIALIGQSGAGKTTLADLIAGLLIPNSGRILCDDVVLTGDQRLAWRLGVAYITQEVFLFHASVRDNLSWVCPNASDTELWQVLEMAAAADFVRALPNQIDTIIGDRGIRLSGGERQRLALARALLSKPQLLILDEATSALDTPTESAVMQSVYDLAN
ncbi:MAG: ATP-binding cassette domain-containing protein, partial [Mariprofundales bacterium]